MSLFELEGSQSNIHPSHSLVQRTQNLACNGDFRLAAWSPALDAGAPGTLTVDLERALAEHVTFLASPELEGRGVGGDGLAQAASYIEKLFQEFGLSPGAADGSYRQPFVIAEGPDGTAEYVVTGGFAEVSSRGVTVLAERALPRAECTGKTAVHGQSSAAVCRVHCGRGGRCQ